MEQTFESAGDDAASFVLSRIPHSDTAAFAAATGAALSFAALRRAALSLAAGLRLGLGLHRGDAVMVISPNTLLLPPIVLGVLAAGGVVVAAAASTAVEIAAVARASGVVIVVAAPEVADKVAAAGIPVPVMLTSRSSDPRVLSAEELMDGGDPTAIDPTAAVRSRPSDVAIVFHTSATTATAMRHADVIAAVSTASSPSPDDDGARVCLACLPICSFHGLPLLALAMPAAGVTTVLLSSDPTAAAHGGGGVTDVVATPEVAAALAAQMSTTTLSSLRRVVVAPPFASAATRQVFRRRLPWVELTEMAGSPEKRMVTSASEQVHVTPTKLIQQIREKAHSVSVTSEAAASVPPLEKIQGDNFSKSTASKILREHPETCSEQVISKL
uniref:AMP-dependent synthetase/ligase domain-containing protein n=1 Tax=Leersia perrieri TaxID=77586 RepID=A0A0D9VMU8_9ORYZ